MGFIITECENVSLWTMPTGVSETTITTASEGRLSPDWTGSVSVSSVYTGPASVSRMKTEGLWSGSSVISLSQDVSCSVSWESATAGYAEKEMFLS